MTKSDFRIDCPTTCSQSPHHPLNTGGATVSSSVADVDGRTASLTISNGESVAAEAYTVGEVPTSLCVESGGSILSGEHERRGRVHFHSGRRCQRQQHEASWQLWIRDGCYRGRRKVEQMCRSTAHRRHPHLWARQLAAVGEASLRAATIRSRHARQIVDSFDLGPLCRSGKRAWLLLAESPELSERFRDTPRNSSLCMRGDRLVQPLNLGVVVVVRVQELSVIVLEQSRSASRMEIWDRHELSCTSAYCKYVRSHAGCLRRPDSRQ